MREERRGDFTVSSFMSALNEDAEVSLVIGVRINNQNQAERFKTLYEIITEKCGKILFRNMSICQKNDKLTKNDIRNQFME